MHGVVPGTPADDPGGGGRWWSREQCSPDAGWPPETGGRPAYVSDLRAEYDAVPATAGRARRDVTAWGAELPEAARVDLVIAVNELVTNSVKHGPRGGRVRLAITRLDESLLFIEVCDDGPAGGVVQRPPDAAGGRGLHMVEFLAKDWGASADPSRTWFTLDTCVRSGVRSVPSDMEGTA